MLENSEIVILGLGYVGLTYSLHLTTKGVKVHGIDNNKDVLKQLNSGNLTFFEEGLEEIFSDALEDNLIDFYSPEEFIKTRKTLENCVFVVTVGTPLNKTTNLTNRSSLNVVFEFLKKVVKDGDGICLRSTVPIGTTKEFCSNLSEKINYCFAPERTIEGKAMDELQNLPQVYGCDDEKSQIYFKKFFEDLEHEVVLVNSSEHAEMVKLLSNVYRDVFFGFSNEVANLCEHFGLNSKQIISAINYKYPRAKIAFPGPVAGPCLSKDTYLLFDNIIEDLKNDSLIFKARKSNENLIINLLDQIIGNNFKDRAINVCVLGIAFKGKPSTGDVRDSYAINIIEHLKKKNSINVSGFDLVVTNDDFKNLNLNKENSIEDAFSNKDLVIIQNNHVVFERMNILPLAKLMNNSGIIFDLWSLHPEKTYINNVKYLNFG